MNIIGGWHHVEVHKDDWWIRKYEAYGFKYDSKLTKELRGIARQEKKSNQTNIANSCKTPNVFW